MRRRESPHKLATLLGRTIPGQPLFSGLPQIHRGATRGPQADGVGGEAVPGQIRAPKRRPLVVDGRSCIPRAGRPGFVVALGRGRHGARFRFWAGYQREAERCGNPERDPTRTKTRGVAILQANRLFVGGSSTPRWLALDARDGALAVGGRSRLAGPEAGFRHQPARPCSSEEQRSSPVSAGGRGSGSAASSTPTIGRPGRRPLRFSVDYPGPGEFGPTNLERRVVGKKRLAGRGDLGCPASRSRSQLLR